MKINSIHIYPIKGLAGISLSSAKVLERGLEYDRRWMLIDAQGEFITQRTDARLALFHCALDQTLAVTYGDAQLSIDLDEVTGEKILTNVWEHQVYTYEVSQAASDWFSDQLGVDCLLVKMVDEFDRYKDLIKGPAQTRVSLADGYPYHIIGTASFDLLADKVGSRIPQNRFRANIIVETDEAHIEDTWDQLKVGSAKLQVIKPCARCLVVNIDQSTGKSLKEPLKSLASYRSDGNVVNFGANSICLTEGSISVGDTIDFIGV